MGGTRCHVCLMAIHLMPGAPEQVDADVCIDSSAGDVTWCYS